MIRNFLAVFLTTLLPVSALLAQPEIKAVFIQNPPEIDGKLDDDVWKNASVINDLYQREPNPGCSMLRRDQNSIFCSTTIIFMWEFTAMMIRKALLPKS